MVSSASAAATCGSLSPRHRAVRSAVVEGHRRRVIADVRCIMTGRAVVDDRPRLAVPNIPAGSGKGSSCAADPPPDGEPANDGAGQRSRKVEHGHHGAFHNPYPLGKVMGGLCFINRIRSANPDIRQAEAVVDPQALGHAFADRARARTASMPEERQHSAGGARFEESGGSTSGCSRRFTPSCAGSPTASCGSTRGWR